MQRCLELARLGFGWVAPNPMVGCVIVHNNKIIGEGWHQKFGGAHAEVNAINSVNDKSLLPESILYVSLEPCCHFGKTPPCTNLIIEYGIKHVVVAMVDPNPLVAGKGIQILKQAGVIVETNVLEEEARFLNRRFIHFINNKKPYVILKWAQTINGMLGPDASKVSKDQFEAERHITGRIVQKLVHKWRTCEDAIMIGTNTAITDNPSLNSREWGSIKNTFRIVLDRKLKLYHTLKIFDNSQPTIIVNEIENKQQGQTSYLKINFNEQLLDELLSYLYGINIQSLVVEGGAVLLNSFFKNQLAQEAIVFTSPQHINNGIKAPDFSGKAVYSTTIDGVTLTQYTL
ncbi:MAG: bifunctional diaminohydroxyphosphoribosylaminopyrimidine deaminase/5-amino-6-(5-phosphoribosylamino)uracil reductase RibD [Bacteroidia bacterium]